MNAEVGKFPLLSEGINTLDESPSDASNLQHPIADLQTSFCNIASDNCKRMSANRRSAMADR